MTALPPPLTGEQLAERREALGMNQKRLASILGLAENTISRWENGNRPIGNPRLVELALRWVEQVAANGDTA